MDIVLSKKDALRYQRTMSAIKQTLQEYMAEKAGLDYMNMMLCLVEDLSAVSAVKFRNRELASDWDMLAGLIAELYGQDDPEMKEEQDIDSGLLMAKRIKEVIGI